MTDTASLERIDSFPYRHRVHEVMGTPIATTRVGATLAEASQAMSQKGISSLVVIDEDGRPTGIVTERDVLKAVAKHRREAADIPLGMVMSSPVASVRQDAFVYVAMGRMDRLKLRHLVAIDDKGVAVGMVTVRGLLHLRAASALVIGDEVAQASSTGEMLAAKNRLPDLAGELLAEGVDAMTIAAVTASVLRDLTGRAAQLAEESMAADSWGKAPAPYCVLLLGSGGRRESLFGADQDNAIVHAGQPTDDQWYAELGRRTCDTLDRAGIPYCKGGVMAMNQAWRHTVAGWDSHIDNWVRHANGEELLNVHIFVDFRAAYGDSALAARVRSHMTEQAARSAKFLFAMAQAAAGIRAPLGMFGQLITQEGRLDIKTSGLLPLTAAVRTLALKHRIVATGTAERLDALAAGGHMNADEARAFKDSHELMVRLLIRQQVADHQAGLAITNRLDPKAFRPHERRRLKEAFKNINGLTWVMKNALSTV